MRSASVLRRNKHLMQGGTSPGTATGVRLLAYCVRNH